MALRWNQTQKDIYELISAGVPKREIKAKGYNEEMIKKVKKAINKGDIPGKPPETKKEPPARGAALQCHSQNDQGNPGPNSGGALRFSAACPGTG